MRNARDCCRQETNTRNQVTRAEQILAAFAVEKWTP
jgi:hypothetical protein